MSNAVKVVKADGAIEPFKVEKLRRSLRRSGASKEEIEYVIQQILPTLHNGIETQVIYQQAFKMLRESELPAAARYSMRRALFNLGPTGFPFEDYLARLITLEGYTTRVGVSLRGACAPHEIDVAAYKDDHSFVAEAKFHSRPGIKSDLQVIMYSYARFLDLKDRSICDEDVCGIKEFWVVTNTKFTSTAEAYAECVGMKLLSWTYPRKNNLYDRIQRQRLYPVTVLQTLSQSQKQELINRKIIVCRDIVDNPHMLRYAHLTKAKTEAVLSEARQLCHA